MTFTEAAIEVLRREGKPLHYKKIAEIAVREGLLDHVGKIPEETMGGQLAAHCRLPHIDRRVLAVQPATFALVEWELDEDPQGIENLVELPPESEPPYRSRERHPVPSREVARSSGRGESGRSRRRDEGEERRRRYPPPAEVAYEILASAGRSLALTEIATQGAERFLMPDAFVRDTGSLAAALSEDNRRRESAGRKCLFGLEGDMVALVAQPEPGEQAQVAMVPRHPASAADLRKSALATFRRRLRECDGPTLELLVVRMLEKLGLHELKVAKRSREYVVYTARRRMGLADVRHCIRILRGASDAVRRDVSELRRDLGHHGAQIGMLAAPGEVAREARGEASSAGQLPVLLLCGEALAESLVEVGIGCRVVLVPEIDEAYLKSATEAANSEDLVRRARREERQRRETQAPTERSPARTNNVDEGGAPRESDGDSLSEEMSAPESAAGAVPDQTSSGSTDVASADRNDRRVDEGSTSGDGEDDEGGETEEPGAVVAEGAQVGTEQHHRKRRRRRRGGRGRGERRPGAPAIGSAVGEGSPAPSPEASPSNSAPTRAEPSSTEGES